MALCGASRRRSFRRITTPLSVALVACLYCGLSRAQTPDQALKIHRFAVINALRNKDTPQQPIFDDYFNKLVFAEFTLPENRNNLPKLRRDLKALYFMQGKSGPAHARLRYLTREKMKEILTPKENDFDEVVKVNAILIVGDLNEQEQEGTARPRPDPDAFQILRAVVTAKNPKTFSDAMRIAAMVGLLRHAEHGSPDPRLASAMLEIVKQEEPTGKRSSAGHAWMRMRAAEILGALGDPGPNGATAQALAQGLADPNNPFYMRREMARALGKLKYPAGVKLNGANVANELGHLAHDVCRDELDRFATLQDSGRAKVPADAPSHRRLRHELYAVRIGLTGVKSLPGSAGDAGFANQVATHVQKLVETSEGSLKGPDFASQLDTDVQALQKMLRKRAVQPKLAEPKLSHEKKGVERQDQPDNDTRAERPAAVPAAAKQ